jgi:hypothetical protein
LNLSKGAPIDGLSDDDESRHQNHHRAPVPDGHSMLLDVLQLVDVTATTVRIQHEQLLKHNGRLVM